MVLQFNRLQTDGQNEVVPEPEDDELKERWKDHWIKVYIVPIEVMVVDKHLHTLEIEEAMIIAVSERLYEITTALAWLM